MVLSPVELAALFSETIGLIRRPKKDGGGACPRIKDWRQFNMIEQIPVAKPATTLAGFAPARFPTMWTHVVERNSRQFNITEQILVAKPATTLAGFAHCIARKIAVLEHLHLPSGLILAILNHV